MKIAILGYSRQGRSAYEYWNTPVNQLTICDQNTEIVTPKGAQTRLGTDYLNNLDDFDLLVRTPALHPREILKANPNSPDILDKVTTVTNEFFRVCPSKHIIGVTGTKGKGTTSTLITRMLEAAGKRAILGGNIGIAPLELLKQQITASDWVVLELANFQLIDLSYSPATAVCLLIEPEHLDWHTDMSEYMEAKSQLFIHQKTQDRAIYYADSDNSYQVARHSPGVLTPYMRAPGAYVKDSVITIDNQAICGTDELQLLGRHNWQNVCAAITAVWSITQDVAALREVITHFVGLPHRLEPLSTVSGVTYYNDSYASAPPATIAALEAIHQPKVLILGGFDRGLALDDLAQAIKNEQQSMRTILLIGQARQRLGSALEAVGFSKFELCDLTSLADIVKQAQSKAEDGDAVLFSPGFASFDMFKDFEERGELFRQAVDAL